MFRQCQEHPEIYTAFNASYAFYARTENATFQYKIVYDMCVCVHEFNVRWLYFALLRHARMHIAHAFNG